MYYEALWIKSTLSGLICLNQVVQLPFDKFLQHQMNPKTSPRMPLRMWTPYRQEKSSPCTPQMTSRRRLPSRRRWPKKLNKRNDRPSGSNWKKRTRRCERALSRSPQSKTKDRRANLEVTQTTQLLLNLPRNPKSEKKNPEMRDHLHQKYPERQQRVLRHKFLTETPKIARLTPLDILKSKLGRTRSL